MKKIVAILLALCTLFSLCFLVSCEKDTDVVENKEVEQEETKTPEGETTEEPVADEPVVEEPKADEPEVVEPEVVEPEASLYETVDAAIKNTLAATSLEAKVRIDKTDDIMGNKSSSWRDVVVKTSGSNISVEGKKYEYDYESDLKYYYDGSWMYFDMYGERYKRQVDLVEFSTEAGGVAGAIVVIPEAAFANATENNGTVEIALDEATVETLYYDTIVGLVTDIVGNDLSQTTTKDAKITLTINNGYIADYTLSLTTEIVVGNDRAAYTFDQTLNLSNVGGAVSVQFPNGYQNFNELDWG